MITNEQYFILRRISLFTERKIDISLIDLEKLIKSIYDKKLPSIFLSKLISYAQGEHNYTSYIVRKYIENIKNKYPKLKIKKYKNFRPYKWNISNFYYDRKDWLDDLIDY